MVLNEKILQRKFEKVVKIINEDGGMTMIEMMGFLRYVEIRYVDEAVAKSVKNMKGITQTYEQLKRKRVGDIGG